MVGVYSKTDDWLSVGKRLSGFLKARERDKKKIKQIHIKRSLSGRAAYATHKE